MMEPMADSGESDRIEALETRLAFQERTIEELNATVTELWGALEQMRRRLEAMEEQVRSGSYIADPSGEQPPPHY
jgi:SlyX protein